MKYVDENEGENITYYENGELDIKESFKEYYKKFDGIEPKWRDGRAIYETSRGGGVMRPLLLEIEGLQSYKEKQVINFENYVKMDCLEFLERQEVENLQY